MKKITDGIRKRENTSPQPPDAIKPPEKMGDEEWFLRLRQTEDTPSTKEPVQEKDIIMPELEAEIPRPGRGLLFWGVASGGAAIVVAAVLLSTVLARVTVMVKPHVESVAFHEVSVALDASVTRSLLAQKVVPAEFFEFSRKAADEFEASGKEFIEERARGKVIVYNRFSSSQQTLVDGTRFLTTSGVLFRLPKTTVIPGAKIEEGKIIPESVETELVADKAGEDFNLTAEITLNIPGFKGTPKYDGFYAVAKNGFAGGFRGEARVISAEDLKKAEEQVTKRVFDELKEEMSHKIPPGFTLLDALREIQISKVISPRSGTRRDRFPVEAEARGRAMVFREEDVHSILRDLVLKEHADTKTIEDSFRVDYKSRSVDYDKKRSAISVQGEVKVQAQIHEDELRALIKGRKEGSIIEILKGRPELASFNVAFFPPWLFTASEDLAKIRIMGGN